MAGLSSFNRDLWLINLFTVLLNRKYFQAPTMYNYPLSSGLGTGRANAV